MRLTTGFLGGFAIGFLVTILAATGCSTEVPGEESPDLIDEEAAGCTRPSEVVIWGTRNFHEILGAIEANRSPCSTFWVALPPVTDSSGRKTMPRQGDVLDRIHDLQDRGVKIRAMAEFHWTSWAGWVQATGRSWYDAGVEFRRRMDEAGYDATAGDTWVVDELPSTVRSNTDGGRGKAMAAVRGLYEGATPNIRGAVLVVGMSIQMTYFPEYRQVLENWLCDAPFWVAMDKHVRFFAQETYASPSRVCVAGKTVAERNEHLNAYLQHLARMAAAGPQCAATARSYFDRSHVPLQTAAWQHSLYGDLRIPEDQMSRFLRLSVSSQKAWAADHTSPDGRLGFAWAPQTGQDPAALRRIADALAGAIARAYAPDGGIVSACSSSGSYFGCDCELSGASLNPAWLSFPAW
ncbi:MAG TPA: hypothetical protein VFU21_31040 [Kofleriaceae bacterium]|nr:hypothetical protein [Kofleriaceae bacterium]